MLQDLKNKTDEIRKFWDSKAREHGESWKATLGEQYLRLLEIKTMIRFIRKYRPCSVLDVGCGNGYSTKVFAKMFPDIQFVGVDYSEKMISLANKNKGANCKFFLGDILAPDSLPDGKFDLILSQRCLQNLVDYENQRKAIKNLFLKKSSSGVLLFMECSKDGVEQLNKTRIRFGDEPLPGIEPWHNNFFIDRNIIDDFGADVVYFSSTYMFLAKVVHPRLGLLGYMLPPIGRFGYDRLYIIK